MPARPRTAAITSTTTQPTAPHFAIVGVSLTGSSVRRSTSARVYVLGRELKSVIQRPPRFWESDRARDRISDARPTSASRSAAFSWYALCVFAEHVQSRCRARMRILRSRETLKFVLLLVQCTCGRRFGHREDRRTVVCFHCGRVADLGKVQ